jgi:excisionase family DNA binding protein
MSEHILTVEEAAERLRVGIGSVYRWIKEGRLPATRLPGRNGAGRLRIHAADLDLVFAPARPCGDCGTRRDADGRCARCLPRRSACDGGRA